MCLLERGHFPGALRRLETGSWIGGRMFSYCRAYLDRSLARLANTFCPVCAALLSLALLSFKG
jgi:hypothetical protein